MPWCSGGSLNRQDTHGSCDTVAHRLDGLLHMFQLFMICFLVTLVVEDAEKPLSALAVMALIAPSSMALMGLFAFLPFSGHVLALHPFFPHVQHLRSSYATRGFGHPRAS